MISPEIKKVFNIFILRREATLQQKQSLLKLQSASLISLLPFSIFQMPS